MYSSHLLRYHVGQILHGQLLVFERPGVYVLLYSASGEDAVQLWTQSSLGKEREDDGLGDDGFQSAFSVGLAVESKKHLFGLILYLFLERFWQVNVVEEVGKSTTVRTINLECLCSLWDNENYVEKYFHFVERS